jgi:hypothetical protein
VAVVGHHRTEHVVSPGQSRVLALELFDLVQPIATVIVGFAIARIDVLQLPQSAGPIDIGLSVELFELTDAL